MKVLIVDDSARVRRLIADFVSPVAAAVIECEDGAAALAAYEASAPDVVLMDIAMRGRDGLAATRDIIGIHPDARVVIVTEYDEMDLRDAARAAGARAYVLKENLHELRSVLADVTRHEHDP
jgi:CheY-like chemotaxis protein